MSWGWLTASVLRDSEEEEEEEKEARYHSVRGPAGPGPADLGQLAGGVGVQLQQRPLPSLTGLAGDRPHHRPDGLASLHHTRVELQGLSHPAPQPAAEPDILTGTTPGVPLQGHPAWNKVRISRENIYTIS